MFFFLFDIYFSGIWHWIYVIAIVSSMIEIIILPLIFPSYNVIGYIIIDISKIKIVMNTTNEKNILSIKLRNCDLNLMKPLLMEDIILD
jgi:hypothetical protein